MTTVKRVSTGVVAELDGAYWGIQYQDGHSTENDFGPIQNAKVADPVYCLEPWYMTYQGSRDVEILKKATLKNIRITTIYQVEK